MNNDWNYSKSELRRLIKQGALYLNGVRVLPNQRVTMNDAIQTNYGKFIVFRIGKKKHLIVKIIEKRGNMLIFDIGCNKGEFVDICKLKYPKCEIVAVDANPEFMGKRKDVEYVNRIVTEVGQDVKTLHVDKMQTGISTVCKKWLEGSRFKLGSKYLPENNSNWSEELEISTITLDELIEDHGNPDIIKIDVEGHELEVLKGLTKKQKKVCFEWAEEFSDELIESIEYLKNLGYENFGMIGYIEESSKVVTFSKHGDSHLCEPDEYFTDSQILSEIRKILKPERRVYWGMLWVK